MKQVIEGQIAPGKPGIEPERRVAMKAGVGTSASECSNVWFTVTEGVVGEVFYPFADQANVRELQLVVTDGEGYFATEKEMDHKVEWVDEGVPAYRVINGCPKGRCEIEKLIYTDPQHDSLIMQVKFRPLVGKLSDYRVYALLQPQVHNSGTDNDAWVEDSKGFGMVFARRHGTTLAMGCSTPFLKRSSGYLGRSDGLSDLELNGELTQLYRQAPRGSVSLAAQIDLEASEGEVQLVVGFGRGRAESGQQVRATLLADSDKVFDRYCEEWLDKQSEYRSLGKWDTELERLYKISTTVMQTHMAKSRAGSMIRSLSAPNGGDLGGYHLVWPRDQVLSGTGFLAAGDLRTARLVLYFLMTNQEADGHWVESMWGDGTPFRDGVEMDETALPILLADALYRQGELGTIDCTAMVRRAACYILRHGPKTDYDRWSQATQYAPFTVATQIAALLAAADMLERAGEKTEAIYLRETADDWSGSIERWLYQRDTGLARELGVEGYYTDGRGEVSCDALALVRYGVRAADDPRILNTIEAIDAKLRSEGEQGVSWEANPGGQWPVLAGERGHYEMARGNFEEAERLLKTMVAQAGPSGMLPEKLSEGEATPLVWAHSEYLKLLRSLQEKTPFDTPPQTIQRYQRERKRAKTVVWRFDDAVERLQRGKTLRIQTNSPATVRWTSDNWETSHDLETTDTGLAVQYVDLPTADLPRDKEIIFTFHWSEIESWEGKDYIVRTR